MATDKITVSLKCKKCGSTVIELPDNHTDDSIAKCKSCQTEFGRYGDIKGKAREVAADHVRGMIRNVFKGKKGWILK